MIKKKEQKKSGNTFLTILQRETKLTFFKQSKSKQCLKTGSPKFNYYNS